MLFRTLLFFHRRLASVPVAAAYLFLVRSMRVILSLLLGIAPVGAAPWPGTALSDVRAYVYNQGDHFAALVVDGRLGPTVVKRSEKRLSAAQIERLETAVAGKRSGSIDLVQCWSPHHGFVFYDARGKAAAWVEVCFTCGNMHSSPPAGVYDMKALRQLVRELKLPGLAKKT